MPAKPSRSARNSLQVLDATQAGVTYPVVIGHDAAASVGRLAEGYDRVALVSCARVLSTAYGKRVQSQLRRQVDLALVLPLPDGERGKTLAQIERAAGKLLAAGATRKTLVVAVGGGAVTDAAGFLAASFMRGIHWIAVPTTLLSMVDAALGGKTGVNLPAAKNMIGAFHFPRAVLSDPASLASLSRRELRSGFGEVLKHACLRPALLEAAAKAAAAGVPDARTVADSVRVKLEVTAADPFEKGERKLLNLGHTFGHGVEAAGRFTRYKHGEAVAVGVAFAFRLARRMGRIGDQAVERVESALRAAGLPIRFPAALALQAATLMATDKKRTAGGLLWVLPRAVGDIWKVEWDVAADPGALRETIREIGEGRR